MDMMSKISHISIKIRSIKHTNMVVLSIFWIFRVCCVLAVVYVLGSKNRAARIGFNVTMCGFAPIFVTCAAVMLLPELIAKNKSVVDGW